MKSAETEKSEQTTNKKMTTDLAFKEIGRTDLYNFTQVLMIENNINIRI
jgi:hypothetical protein